MNWYQYICPIRITGQKTRSPAILKKGTCYTNGVLFGDIKIRTSTFSKSLSCFRVRQGSGRRKERKGTEAKSLPQGLKKQVIRYKEKGTPIC